ncbi:ATP synthase subunit e, mitochondrial-like [Varroa jacobsoni]|uniref:ATP synthase F(0) complex subunit e, mitochondrial n=1 Tax=Varroa destructor TaxID=109461 RepID=A0A7M7KBX3_VARDE|nr:ATP synthase subunit e, mitochondrial-like [Varroa destructor]XP_022706143.1 ATP synthase subunit e, mitochondrial-like [Varroa jacobsoni]
MTQVLPPPLNVSPFIRGSRWIAFFVGIGYGSFHYNRLSKKEARRREAELQYKLDQAKKKAAEKMRANRAEMLTLAKEVGVEVPADFDKQFPLQ